MNKITPTILLRYSFAVLFFWFGYQQLTNAQMWVGYLPSWTGYLPMPGEMFVRLNGWFEIVAATALTLNVYTRFISLILALHLFGIAISAGGAIGMRDAILAMIGISLAWTKNDSSQVI